MIDPIIVSSVTKIANAIMKKRGFLYKLNEADVEIILEAQALLVEKIKHKSE